MVKCEICGEETKTHKCVLCNKDVCNTHYHHMIGICSGCVKEDDPIPKGYIESLLNSD